MSDDALGSWEDHPKADDPDFWRSWSDHWRERTEHWMARQAETELERDAGRKQLEGAVATLTTISEVLDRGTADERKLATIRRLVNAALASPTAGGQ